MQRPRGQGIGPHSNGHDFSSDWQKGRAFLELFEDPADGFNVGLARVLQNVVQIHDNKNIELFGEDLIDVVLKAG